MFVPCSYLFASTLVLTAIAINVNQGVCSIFATPEQAISDFFKQFFISRTRTPFMHALLYIPI